MALNSLTEMHLIEGHSTNEVKHEMRDPNSCPPNSKVSAQKLPLRMALSYLMNWIDLKNNSLM